jgi:pyrimidine operon attenuation protein/uracil phosphoribosyltransferase
MNEIDDVTTLLDAMAGELQGLLAGLGRERPAMVGIHTGGVWVAKQLHRRLGLEEPLGSLDISFYRDDFTRIGMNPVVKPSELPFSIDNRHLILIDDVLHTGRTIRAAMNELFERDGRELPIQANVVGRHIELDADRHIKLSGPDPLRLEIRQA